MTIQSGTLDSTRLLLVGSTEWVEPFAEALETRTGAAVQTVETAAAAREAVADRPVDAVVSEYALPDGTGVELLGAIREDTTTLPVVLATAAGDESVASDAIAAGVSEYVAVDGPPEEYVPDLLERAEQAVRSARRRHTQRDRARQFDSIFHDARTATWVLSPDGELVRMNQTAREMADAATETLVGEPFWTLPCWSRPDGLQTDVKRIVETAIDGEFGNAVVMRSPGSSPRVVELSVRPVENEHGALVSLVVEGVDITNRVELEQDLRQSEELHRVTLNNMTDTVLMTDEDGAYTYVCPNVHFIFGYTVEEIRELGTIDALLGSDLFDREELAEEGSLKNIECTVTDKAGREHTLLVNVREVSIQDGTLLYSCRDITKRKQREEALATLQETARDFLYAETHREIAQHVVEDTASVLGFDASAVYLFDAETNDLDPAASSPTMRELNGPVPSVHATGETLPSYSFVNDEPLFFDDVHDADRLDNRATELRSTAYIPLGDHGVFVSGSADVDAFDEVTRELADLLAATAEAAFDRVTRESRLREQDRALQQQNDRLTALNRVNETIREIDQALVQAETREEIHHTVCDRLTADDRFSFAWVGTRDARTETVTPEAWAGDERGYLDSRPFSVGPSGVEPAGRTAATGELTIIDDVSARLREEAWRKEALSRDYLSVVSIPLVYNNLTYGVLTVYAETQNEFEAMTREVLEELGETIASAISGIERKNALLTTAMTRVEFEAADASFVLSRLARDAECTLSYQGGAQQTETGSTVFVTVEDASLDAVAAAARSLVAVDDAQQISADSSGGVLRLQLSEPFLAQTLANHGAVFRSASVTPSATTLVVDIPESVTVRHVTKLTEDAVGAVELRSKQRRDLGTELNLSSRFFEALTDRQLEVLQTAYYSGFFESPRESSGEDVAETLGISASAFYQHSRAVQRKLFAAMFEEHGGPARDAAD
ncbi:bacterio-opsin activator domain-containing protein [Halobaculum sp. D14]|uniref:bacterio-opsin activator domain-containing protein n=1 Tax=Halobaculum sp. D14 TaxID=3421642 RepID=UPI003EB9DE80